MMKGYEHSNVVDKNLKVVKWLKATRWIILRIVLLLLPNVILWFFLETSSFITADSALEWWGGFLALHLVVGGALIYCVELRQIKKKLNEYKFKTKDRDRRDTEGYQSFLLLSVSIHGIASVTAATISYFMIASFFNQDLQSYIFLNNEGAIAAITLVIVVASAAVVAVYVELARSVRQQIDSYEVEISALNQVVVEINDSAEQVWGHFDSVAHTLLDEWKETLKSNPNLLSRARINDLERPLELMASFQEFSGREFQEIDDREFWKYDDQAIRPHPPNQGVNESYSRIEDLEHSRVRYRHSMNLDERREPNRDLRLKLEDQRSRTRRLRYLGWNQHGLSGIIEVLNISREWKRAVKHLENAARRIQQNPEDYVPFGTKSRKFLEWLVNSELLDFGQFRGNELQTGPEMVLLKKVVAGTRNLTASEFRAKLRARLADEHFADTFKRCFFRLNDNDVDEGAYDGWWNQFTNGPLLLPDSYDTFAPAHEKSLVYVMRGLSAPALDADGIEILPEESVDGREVEYAIRDFDRRVWGSHLNRTVSLEARRIESGLVATLNKLCAQLDLDPSVFIDDLEVFVHLRGLVLLDPERTDGPTTKNAKIERRALYRYAAYSRFLFYAFWLVEGPARFGASMRSSSSDNIERLKEWIDCKTSREVIGVDTTDEFLLLMLADQRSALFNWLRSVRARTVRKNLVEYEGQLENEQGGLTRHFGIEVIPARHLRLKELQKHLKVSDDAQKPIRLRSVYELVPRQTYNARIRAGRPPERDQRYIDTYRFISFSTAWERNVTIPGDTMQRVYEWLNDRTQVLDDINLRDRQLREYLSWLVDRVFGARDGRPDPAAELQDDALLIVRALWLVSPTVKARFEGRPIPALGRAEELEQYRAALTQISLYCLDPNNADHMRNTFFGGADPATRGRAREEYDRWLTDFRQRTIATTEGN